ncbi:MAG: hypothetical protein J07HB67_02445 [halophilic archaeon J07HB67]|nr:MAG: hypothetical protein J07HB67_02445 [halophilic archaeon J07HB67]
MTLWPLVSLRSPADFADWFRAGVEYTIRVARALDVDPAPLPAHRDRGLAAMRADRTEVSPALARTIGAVLSGDAAFGRPFLRWTPRWYRLLLAGPIGLADRRLTRVATPYVDRGGVERPSFSTPETVTVDGQPLDLSGIGFADRFLLADALLHVEWFRDVAEACGLAVPDQLLDRTRRESAAVYAGRGGSLSASVRRVQFALFGDDAWVRDVDTTYRLNSTLLSVWEGILRRERHRLGATLREPNRPAAPRDDGRE